MSEITRGSFSGKLISREIINEDYEVWSILENTTGAVLPLVIQRGSDYDALVSCPYVTVNSTICGILNSNRGHEYPEGTIGRDSKGF